MLELAARVGRQAGAGLLAICTLAVLMPVASAASAAPALQGSGVAPRGQAVSNLAPAAGGAGVLWTAFPGLGLLRSIDSGASWKPAPIASPLSWSGVVTDPVDPLTVYAEGSAGLAQSTDGGATWRIVNPTPSGVLAIAPGAPRTLYLASSAGILDFTGVSRSDDGGATWRPLAPLPPAIEGIYEVDVDPANPDNVYVMGFAFHLDVSPAALHSADGGQSWSYVGDLPGGFFGYLNTLRWDSRIPGTLLGVVGTDPVRSRDAGTTWEIVRAGLPAGASPTGLVFDRSSGTFYLALETTSGVGQIWSSVDDGTSWTQLFARPGGLQPLALDGAVPGRLYAGAEDVGLLASADAGRHWQVAGAGIVLSPPPAGACLPSDSVLCLEAGRFALRVHWALGDGTGGDAHVSPLTDGGGGFWFFSPESVELVVKMVDGRPVNGRFWLFGGALSDVAYTLTVTEVATAKVRTYINPRGRLASFADTNAFAVAGDASPAVGAPFVAAPTATPAGASCVPAADTLCLAASRFAVRVSWRLPGIASTSATAVPLFQNTGAFWFFAAGNPELVVKILDGRALNGHFWVFFAGLSGVDSTVTVTDTATGATKTYHHPEGAPASSADTAF
ncbi:MAG TPA: sialidase family protein [Thermoanaerobaculia bacterium]|nr:sialidase family protein [Thermoanaerobaculia bacterium]